MSTQYLTLLGASLLAQSMYSPVLIVDCYKFKVRIMNEYVYEDFLFIAFGVKAYLAEKSIARDLETNDE